MERVPHPCRVLRDRVGILTSVARYEIIAKRVGMLTPDVDLKIKNPTLSRRRRQGWGALRQSSGSRPVALFEFLP
jgi:hypothetical protein